MSSSGPADGLEPNTASTERLVRSALASTEWVQVRKVRPGVRVAEGLAEGLD